MKKIVLGLILTLSLSTGYSQKAAQKQDTTKYCVTMTRAEWINFVYLLDSALMSNGNGEVQAKFMLGVNYSLKKYQLSLVNELNPQFTIVDNKEAARKAYIDSLKYQKHK